jgi:ParB-like chromosome segregation protein Spo0J
MPPLPVIIKTENLQGPPFASAHQIEYVSPSSLQPDNRNARKHTSAQKRAIAKSLDEFGFNAPILVDRNNTVIVGHGRLSAAILLKLAKSRLFA